MISVVLCTSMAFGHQIIDLYKSDFIKAVQDFDRNPPLKELYVKYNTLLPSSASALQAIFYGKID